MTVKELIKHLRMFDEEHYVIMQIDTQCGHLQIKTTIDDVQWKNGNCVLYAEDY